MIFGVFAKNEAPKGLLGNTLPYNQLIIYILVTLCAIFMPLASKLWHSQWFEVGQSAMAKSIFGQLWIFDRPHSARPLDQPAPYPPPLAFTRPLPDNRGLPDTVLSLRGLSPTLSV